MFYDTMEFGQHTLSDLMLSQLLNNVSKKLKINLCIFSFFFKILDQVPILIFMPEQKIGLSDISYH